MKLRINIVLLALFQVSVSLNLKYFETIATIKESSYVKRDATGQKLNKYLRFNFQKRSFHVNLQSGTTVLAQDFKSFLVQEDERTEEFLFDQSNVFSGHLVDNSSVFVNAYKAEELWSIHIFEDNEIYAVEPTYNLLNKDENPFNHSMFAYRASDLVDTGGKCGVKNSPIYEGGHSLKYKVDNSENLMRGNGNRKTRSSRQRSDTCLIHAVGDYDFFKLRCNANYVVCSSLMISFINFADSIYKSSNFIDMDNSAEMSIRLQIARLDLYQTKTKNVTSYSSEQPHFNSVKSDWESETKLSSFAYYMSFLNTSYCHHHLFTQYPMPERVLGLGFVAAACYVGPPKRLQFNTALTSGEDKKLGPISSLQMSLVFAHGHNLGSEHDPATQECSHPDEKGGEYIMWEMAVSGKHPNHKKFSPCSLRVIGTAMKNYACLTRYKDRAAFCGNGIVDSGEECDSGFLTENECCDKFCKLNVGALCSETNVACCVGCQMASNTTICSDGDPENCRKISICTGYSFDCPKGDILEDWTECTDGGVCYQGKCMSYCELKSVYENVELQPCLCREEENACKWCCYDNTKKENPGKCHPFFKNESLKDGTPCDYGFCNGGVCKPHSNSAIKRLVAFFQSFENTDLAKFMKTNIVYTVVILVLLVWTPCAILLGFSLRYKCCRYAEKCTNEIAKDRNKPPNEDGVVNETDHTL